MSFASAGLWSGISRGASMVQNALLGVEERHLAQEERKRLAEERADQKAQEDMEQGITRGVSSTTVDTRPLTPRSGATMFQGSKLGGLGAAVGAPVTPSPLAVTPGAPAGPVPSVMAGERLGPAGRLKGIPALNAPGRSTIETPQVPTEGVQFGGSYVDQDITKSGAFRRAAALHRENIRQAQEDKDARDVIDAPERADLIRQLKDPALQAAAVHMDMPALRQLIVKDNTPSIVIMPQAGGGAVSIDKNDLPAGATPIKGADPYHPLPGAGGSGGGFGAGGMLGGIKATAAIPALRIAHDNMRAFEEKAVADPALYDGIDQFLTLLGGNFQEKSVLGSVRLAAANAYMGKHNSELANYLQNVHQWSLEDSAISGRPSDYRTELDAFVSSMKANPSPQTMKSIWDAREVRLNAYERGLPAIESRLGEIAGPTKTPSGNPPPMSYAPGADGKMHPAASVAPPAGPETPGQAARRRARERKAGGGK